MKTPSNLELDGEEIYDTKTGKTVSNIEFSEVLKLAIKKGKKSELIKALKQSVDEVMAENKALRIKILGMAVVQVSLTEEITGLQADKAELQEKILNLEACK